MTRLPPPLNPLWSTGKVVHRKMTHVVGTAGRRIGRTGPTAVPHRASPSTAQTAAGEPDDVEVHALSDGYVLRRDVPVGSPAPLRYWDDVVTSRAPDRFVAEVRGGRVVGIAGACITPAGVLDEETSNYFGTRSWKEHPVYLRPTLPRPTHISGTVLSLASHGSSVNYSHALLDAMPRWGMAQELGIEPDVVVVAHRSPWDAQLVAHFGLDRYPLVQPRNGMNIVATRLIVPSLPNPEMCAPPAVTDWLRARMPPRPDRDRAPRRLYVTRGSRPHTRRYVQEAALVEMLRPRGFEVVDPGRLPLQDQIDTFAAAEVVVGPHGTNLTNLVFSPPDVKVLELFAPHYLNPCTWAIVANLPGSVYRYLVAAPAPRDRPAARMTGGGDDIDIDPHTVVAAVDDLLGH